MQLTRILSILGADVIVTRVQDVLVHECGSRRDLPEESQFYALGSQVRAWRAGRVHGRGG